MDVKARLDAHMARWGIPLDPGIQLLQTRNRLEAVFSEFLVGHLADLEPGYVYLMGSRPPAVKYPTTFSDTAMGSDLENVPTAAQLAHVLQLLFMSMESLTNGSLSTYFDQENLEKLAAAVKEVLALSPILGISLSVSGTQVTVHPSGDGMLDRELVDVPLQGLQPLPDVAEHYRKALELGLSGNEDDTRNALDELRFSLEQLVKRVLGNTRNLENNREELLRWLDSKGLHKQLRNWVQDVLQRYTQYQNDAVKHDEGFSREDFEIILYLTGALMRTILRFT